MGAGSPASTKVGMRCVEGLGSFGKLASKRLYMQSVRRVDKKTDVGEV
jgi:hypothetical protein